MNGYNFISLSFLCGCIGRRMFCLNFSNCSLSHSAMGFRSMARTNFVPSVFLRIEFPCILQRLSLDERCGLPFIKPDKAAEVFDTEHFTEIGKPCRRLCDYRFSTTHNSLLLGVTKLVISELSIAM